MATLTETRVKIDALDFQIANYSSMYGSNSQYVQDLRVTRQSLVDSIDGDVGSFLS